MCPLRPSCSRPSREVPGWRPVVELHSGSHFKRGWEGGRPQSHIGMHEIAGVTGIVHLFLFEEKRILIVCWGEKDS